MAIACKIIFHISLFCSCLTFREAISKLTFILWLSKAQHKIFRIENCRFLGKQIYLKVMRNSIFEYFLCKNWIYLEELGYELFMRIKITCQGWNTLILLNDLIIIFLFFSKGWIKCVNDKRFTCSFFSWLSCKLNYLLWDCIFFTSKKERGKCISVSSTLYKKNFSLKYSISYDGCLINFCLNCC